jgi:hypothetical protein
VLDYGAELMNNRRGGTSTAREASSGASLDAT